MTEKFRQKVLHDRLVDTAKYRYIAEDEAVATENGMVYRTTIKRLPLESLDTTAAIDGWETVLTIEC